MSNRQTHFVIDMHAIDVMECEPDNDDRAAFVAPLVHAFATAYYWGSEEIHIVVQDMISDLGHFLDRYMSEDFPNVFVRDGFEPGEIEAFKELCDAGFENYAYEVDEERETPELEDA